VSRLRLIDADRRPHPSPQVALHAPDRQHQPVIDATDLGAHDGAHDRADHG
jgi:hypothetical protein